jgi:methyl-accepting chemotaxis protein WspA
MLDSIVKNKTLQGKIMTGFLSMGGLVFLIASTGLISTFTLSGDINTLSNNSLPSVMGLWKINEGQTQIESSERMFLVPGLSAQERQAEFQRIKQAWTQIDEGFKQYETTPRSSEEDVAYKKLQDNWNKWKKDHEELLKLVQQFESIGISNPYKRQGELLIQNQTKSPEFEVARKAGTILDQLRDRAKNNRSSFDAATQSLLASLKINENAAIQTEKQANNNINYSRFLSFLAIIFGPTSAFILGKFLSQTLTRQIQKSVIQITTSATQIAASGKELEATVAEQLASTNEVTTTAVEIAATSKELVKTMDNVASMTQSTANAASHSQDELARMETVMHQLMEATSSISSKLGVMNAKANNINNVVVTITKVADRTSILSLNAAIEAEKAGEYGSGFAVVAREIRRLANQTAVATLEIEQIVKDMQSAVSVGVMEMDKFNHSVSESTNKIGNISDQVSKVIFQVQSLPPQFDLVSQSVEEQSQGAQQISEAMEQLSEASHQTVDALRETNSALEQLDDAARGLRNSISRQI